MSDMSTQGRGARVKNPTTKLTVDNLVKLVLSSHRENIAAAEARKLPPTGPTSQSAQVFGTSSSTTAAAPPSTLGPSITNVDAGPSSSALPAKCSFKATVVDADDEDEFNQSSDSDPAPVPGKGKEKKRKKKRARTSGST